MSNGNTGGNYQLEYTSIDVTSVGSPVTITPDFYGQIEFTNLINFTLNIDSAMTATILYLKFNGAAGPVTVTYGTNITSNGGSQAIGAGTTVIVELINWGGTWYVQAFNTF